MKRMFLLLLSIIIVLIGLQLSCSGGGINRITINPLIQQKPDPPISWSEPKVKPSLESYTVSRDLSNILNISAFEHLDELDRYMLYKNMFIIKKSDTSFEQPFNLYEQNSQEGVPNFITSDSILHVYHLMYDYIIRDVERERILYELRTFTEGAFNKSIAIYKGVSEPNVKNAALKNIAYFGIAMRLMGIDLPGGIPMEANRMIDNDVKKVKTRWNSGSSEIFPYYIDYKKYIAKGHYLRETDFNNYFLTMMWYANTPFMFDIYDSSTGSYRRMDEQIIMAVITTSGILGDENLKKLWEDIYNVTSALYGKAEDVNLYDMSDIIKVMYGKEIDFNKLWNNDMIQKVYELARQRYNLHSGETIAGRINLSNTNLKLQTQFRLMEQMYGIDTDIYSNLTDSGQSLNNQERQFPKGLDVPSAFGSEEAFAVLKDELENEEALDQYPGNMMRLRGVLSGVSGDNPSDYSFNNSSLWAMKPLTLPYNTGYPSFMNNENWSDKRLLTFSGTVSDNRHPTYLVAKQGDTELKEREVGFDTDIAGYVEPEVSLYSRLEYMSGYLKSFLSVNNFHDPEVYSALDSFISTVSFLKGISVKEIENGTFSDSEELRIKNYGMELKKLSICMVEGKGDIKEWELIPTVDRNIASVSDAYPYGSQVLQTAIGFPDYVYVVIPYNGKLYITRGSVYSYYEFVKPVSRKLEDKAWQNMLNDGKEAEQQMWIKKIRY